MNTMERFQQWFLLRDLSFGCLPKYGDFPCVYVFRDKTSGEILKFGSATKFRNRVFVNYLCGMGGNDESSTTQWIHKQLIKDESIERVEVSWHQTQNVNEARSLEKELQARYRREHGGKRPVWERSG